MDANLVNMIIPLRKSAAQASRAFADQLDSSDDDSQPGGSNGDPKKTKKKDVWKKGTPGRGAKLQTYGKRARKAAGLTTAISSLSAKLELESPEAESSPRAPKPKPKPIVKRKRSPSLMIHSSSPMKQLGGSTPVGAEEFDSIHAKDTDKDVSFLYATPPEPTQKRAKISHDRPLSVFTQDTLSDLSSLSHSAVDSCSDSEVEILSYAPAALPPSEPAGSASTLVGSNHGRVEPIWTSQNLGSYVWVLIEPTKARVVDPNKDQGFQDEYKMWWPGKITSSRPTEIPLRVKLFGQRNIVIHEPSEGNIVSKLDALGRWRYQSPIFASSPLEQTSSSSKKQVGNDCDDLKQNRGEELEDRWRNAVIEMKQAEEDEQDSDYLPGVGEILSMPTPGSMQDKGNGRGKKKGKRKRTELPQGDGDWEPPPPDETLDIPGELVLARVNPGRGASAVHNSDHWPAKILAYKAPKHQKQPPKYVVKWLDGSEGEIQRPCFYTMDEEGFATCKLGSFESSVVEFENDDEKEDLEVYKARWDFSRRSPSPEALDPPPSMEDFRQLSIRVRFAYTKPVLTAILNKRYEPVSELHESFMAGGQKRNRLLEYSSRRGNMDPVEVGDLTNYLKEWCLRPHMHTQEDDTQGEVKHTAEQDEIEAGRVLPESPKQVIRSFADLVRGESRSPSPATEPLPSSPAEMPPSSFPVERKDSFMSDLSPSEPGSAVIPECMTTADAVPADIPDMLSVDDRAISRTERLPRRNGCVEYEALTDLDRLNYCTTILLPECIRQILLWQNGLRTCFELLSAEEERELFEKGEMLLNETEWVFNVKRLRQKAEEVLKRNGTGRRRTQAVDYRE